MTTQTLSGRILSVATDHARALDLLPPGAEQARATVTEAYEASVAALLQENLETILCHNENDHKAQVSMAGLVAHHPETSKCCKNGRNGEKTLGDPSRRRRVNFFFL